VAQGFGAIAEQHFLDRTRQVVSFEPGSIFAFVRWAFDRFRNHSALTNGPRQCLLNACRANLSR
jgi:hypothetical protein